MPLPAPPSHIQSLQRYIAGRSIEDVRKELGLERIIKLASNENPLGASPRAVEEIQKSLAVLDSYPDGGLALRERLAEVHHIGMNEVCAGSGSEAVLSAFMRAYLVPGDEVITAEGTFIGFYVLANSQNLKTKTVPLKNYTFDLSAIRTAITPDTKLVYIANPNNPTGSAFTRHEYEQFLVDLPPHLFVIMDEAYYEYAVEWDEYPDSLSMRNDQVLTLRTFSKAYGLAGVRIGYGIGHPELIDNILKVKLPFEPTAPASAGGMGALEDTSFLRKTIEENREGRARLAAALSDLRVPYVPSVANFILVILRDSDSANEFSKRLLMKGIIARPMGLFRLPHTVRITIGTHNQMDYLLEILNGIFSDDELFEPVKK